MFRLFRILRNELLTGSKTNRYLAYAIGELLLVIAGILIALQINNWNEQRLDQKEIREYALNLAAAIERDMQMLKPVEMQILASIRQAEVLASYIRSRNVREMDNAELFFLTTHLGYRPYGWNRAALEQLKSAGGLRRMENRDLAERISDYDALTQHLDQDYREDEEAARDTRRLVMELVDINYDPNGLEEVLTWPEDFDANDIETRLTHFRETEAFARLSAMQKPILSQDLAAFRRLGNMNRKYAENTHARPGIELPRLRKFAAEIQALIHAEYR